MWLSVGARPWPVKRPDVSGTALSRLGLATDHGALTASANRVADGVIRDRSRGRFGVLRMDIGALASAFVGSKIAEAQWRSPPRCYASTPMPQLLWARWSTPRNRTRTASPMLRPALAANSHVTPGAQPRPGATPC